MSPLSHTLSERQQVKTLCVYCASPNINEGGLVYRKQDVVQRWRCRDCLRSWTVPGTVFHTTLQRSISRWVEGTEYLKHQVVIPNGTVAQLKWRRGDYLEGKITPRGLLLYRIMPKIIMKPPSYGHFKRVITEALRKFPKGCTWSELKLAAGLHQDTPSPIWTKRLEDEGVLERSRIQGSQLHLWKLKK